MEKTTMAPWWVLSATPTSGECKISNEWLALLILLSLLEAAVQLNSAS